MLSKGTEIDWEHLRGAYSYCTTQTDLVLADSKYDDFLLSNNAIEDYMQEFNIKREIINFNDKDNVSMLRKSKADISERFSIFNGKGSPPNDRSPTLKKANRNSTANNSEVGKGGSSNNANNRKSILSYLEQISRPIKRKTNLIGEGTIEVKEEENDHEEAPKGIVSKERFSMALKKTFGIDLDQIVKEEKV
jgi:hypothetical protein